MSMSTPAARRAVSSAWKVVRWIIGSGLLVGLIVAVAQCSIEQRNARTAAVQTYNMSRIAAFRDSGSELDKKVAAFNDAATEGRDVTETRQAVRSALADHAAKTMAMSDTFDRSALDDYTSKLKVLQATVEAANDETKPGPIIIALSRVVVARNALSENASKRATG